MRAKKTSSAKSVHVREQRRLAWEKIVAAANKAVTLYDDFRSSIVGSSASSMATQRQPAVNRQQAEAGLQAGLRS